MHAHTNRLIRESSPYLLQHAHNPVDWYPWGEEAFEKARKEDKPVLVSIGYSACHWCHVMERESFEQEDIASIMNENFVNIKVDREERPDVDHMYMDAVQAISGSGGWPLNVFLTPDRMPFYGGTYFPPKRAYNRASWPEVLLSIAQSFRDKREEIRVQAQNLMGHLQASNSFGINPEQSTGIDDAGISEAVQNILKTADRDWGGFGRAPKFPQTATIQFLLQYAQVKNYSEAQVQALVSLDRMMQGGIYDHAGGGFARYATDTEWLVPHFEKMLYDNALLVAVYAEAYSITKNPKYREVIEETLGFAERELMHPDGGFYSALDADSEGEEGKFYVWSLDEVREVLGKDAEIFSAYFDITEKGNWEGKNILRVKQPLSGFSAAQGIQEEELARIIRTGKEKLLQKRAERVRPQLDDKVILGWNALMNTAYSKAYAATGNNHYLDMAKRNMDFILRSFRGAEGLLHHTWKNGEARHPGFLDDYANLVAALVELGQVSGETVFFDRARELSELVLAHFSDEEDLFFYFTHKGQTDVPVRKKEVYDGATPSGNAVMAYNLHRLSLVFNNPGWRERSEAMSHALSGVCLKYPTSFGVWVQVFFEQLMGTTEVVIVGGEWKNYLPKVLGVHISHKLAMASAKPLPGYPLLADKAETSEILIYVCKNYACRQPVSTIQGFVSLLHGK